MRVYLNRTSNAPLRVRIAIALKQIAVEEVHVAIEDDEQHERAFQELNPQRLVPVLVDGEHVIRQSLAIMEFLEETKPSPPLLPRDPQSRARVRSLALLVACDGQPLVNLRVRQYLEAGLKLPKRQQREWLTHWIRLTLREYDQLVQDGQSGTFSHGNLPTLADVCLVPHVLMAERFKIEVRDCAEVQRIFRAMMALDEVRGAVESHAA
jgi:maleylacetoacetate isomerase